MSDTHKHLPRLPDENYQGHSYVHWTMTTQDRAVGWLTTTSHLKLREVLTHTMFRYALACPIYCCMPDHLHLLWIGILPRSDQRVAAKYFRRHINRDLELNEVEFQRQAHDHVLRESERDREAFEAVAEYIARNPERSKLVPIDEFRDYEFSGCVVPGYPELSLWLPDYWMRFWR